MSRRVHNMVQCLLTLIMGATAYILLRPDTAIASVFANNPWIVQLQRHAAKYSLDFLRYYLPDFLWCYAFCCALHGMLEISTPGSL